jgi:LmbE family N-acetylglucosaminyl deacetylase
MNGDPMGTVWLIEPHCDDFLISMGLAAAHYRGAGYNMKVLTMSPGGSGGVLDDLNGTALCGWHGTHHNPAVESYAPVVEEDFATLRSAESRASLGTLAAAVTGTGSVEYRHADLPPGFGGVYGKPATAAGIAAAKAVIADLVDSEANGTTFFHTMSPTDNHPDHAACGIALRQLKQDPAYSYQLGGSRFFASRLYWNDADVIAEGTTTFPVTQARKAEYDKAVRMAAKCYAAWRPPHSLGVGYHQVINQFYSNGLDSQGNGNPTNSISIECRWHD